jgi:hypothetical protein
MRGCFAYFTILLLCAAVSGAAAQNECGIAGYGGNSGRVCQTFIDGVKTFHPLAGMILSGGSPVIGSAATLGLGHATVAIRLNAATVAVPNADSAAQPSVPASFEGLLPAPHIETAFGIIRGLPGGMFAADFLGSALLLPTGEVAGLTVDSHAARLGTLAFGFGYGLRVGVKRGRANPAVSFSIMRRHLPRLRYGAGTGDSAQFSMNLQAVNFRFVTSVQLVLVEVAAGVGVDRYTSSADVTFIDPAQPMTNPQRVPLSLRGSRGVFFVDAALDLVAVDLVGELGYQTGKNQHLATNFTGFDPTAGRIFGGLGLRFVF